MGNIYVVTNMKNNKQYVGQTIHLVEKRMKEHSHDDWLLGKAIRKYGMENFAVKEYLNIREEWIDWFEQAMIQHCNSVKPNGYNLHLGGQGNRKVSEETRQKISESKKGQPSPNKGKFITEEQKKKISETHTGHKWTDEQRANLSKIRREHPEKYKGMLGKKMSEETKKKMSESAKKVIHTPEWNKKVGESQKGKVISEETKDKIRNTLLGRTLPDEYKKEQSIRMKKWWADKKAKEKLEENKS